MIAILGAGAFGTALAVALSQGGKPVALWARDSDAARKMHASRINTARLPGVIFPGNLIVTHDTDALNEAKIILVACPAQKLGHVIQLHEQHLNGKPVVACAKGIDLATGLGPTGTIAKHLPQATAAILSGPSFAADIGAGLPTALTIAAHLEADAQNLQRQLATPSLRLYSSADPAGVEIGGALKNVIAIACGACIGAGLGDSARAALMTRGFAEMMRLAMALGARADTLMGLAGFGDLALTCTSDLSRNYRYGLALGRDETFDKNVTVEGASTAAAAVQLAAKHGLDLPISETVAQIVSGASSVGDAIQGLLARPLRAE